VFNKTPGALEAIIDGLSEEPVNLVVAIGSDQDASRFGTQPPNVRMAAYLPQPLLLQRCDVFVTHGGFNSVKESLAAGVPMVVVPITADQPYNAERCAAHGVGRVVGAAGRTAEAIREAVRDVLTDPGYCDNARRLQGEMSALPGAAQMVDQLTLLSAARNVRNDATTAATAAISPR
jgi:N-glycosyltransferase